MKAWLKKTLPFPVKLALKRALSPFLSKSQVPTFSFETPRLSGDGRVNFDEVNEFLRGSPRPTERSIKVSIVLLVFNKAEFNFQCLRSLISEIDLNECEVIVVNNASTDQTSELLHHFKDYIEVVNNEENHGFVDACNQGAAIAKGEFLLFLNNDTMVLPGWLDELLATFQNHPEVGVAGPLFLYPEGLVQEAGSIVWSNGDAYHYGWGGSPEDRRFVFARDVDYVSGASLMIRTSLFKEIGGFDRRYAPAHYEDADLCFAARAAGYRVIYQPASKIIHYEGVTWGRDVNVGMKQYQVINKPKFVEKWNAVLTRDHYAYESANIEKAAHRLPKESVVVFDDRVPTPDLDAGSARMVLLLRILSKKYRTAFVYKARNDSPQYEQALWREGIETFELVHYPRLLKERNFKTAIVSRPELAEAVLKSIRRRARSIKIVFDTVDAHFLRLAREFEITKDLKTKQLSESYQRMEGDCIRASDVVWFTSQADATSFATELRGKETAIIPTIHPLKPKGNSFSGRHDFLFIGNFNHRPNIDAVIYFLEQVLPVVRKILPDVQLHVIGSNAPSEFDKYTGLKLHGYVPDIAPLFGSCRVFVAPLRFGAGVNGKLGEALSYGLPIVTTDVGASGLHLENGTNALIANSSEAFVEAVLSVYRDETLWNKLSENGREHVRLHFSPEALEKVILESVA